MLRLALVIALSSVILVPARAEAGLLDSVGRFFGNVGRGIGRVVGAPFGGFADAASAPVVSNVESSARRLVADVDARFADRIKEIGALGSKTIAQADVVIAARIVQLDRVALNRIKQVDASLKARIEQIDRSLQDRIKELDGVLETRTDQVHGILTGAIAQADASIEARLNQLDQAASIRIGNVDTVAAKATYNLERTLTRLITVATILIVLAGTVWRASRRKHNQDRSMDPSRPGSTLQVWWRPALYAAFEGALGLAVILVAFTFVAFGPWGATAEAERLAQRHLRSFEDAVTTLSFTEARYHASQLVFLDVGGDENQGRLAKTEVLRDLLERPGLAYSRAGRYRLLLQLDRAERLLGEDDPDLNAAAAILLLSSTTRKDAEVHAARLAAKAIETSSASRPSPLLGVALSYVENALHRRCPDDICGSDPALDSRLERAKRRGHLILQSQNEVRFGPLDYLAAYNERVRALDAAASDAYVETIEAHARWVSARALGPEGRAERRKHLQRRVEAAKRVVAAWDSFVDYLLGEIAFATGPAQLAALMLNDAPYTRAMVYATEEDPEGPGLTQRYPEGVAPSAEITAKTRGEIIAHLPRVRLARTFGEYLSEPTLEVVGWEESERFQGYQRQLIQYEKSIVAFFRALQADEAPDAIALKALEAVRSAAPIGLYVAPNPGQPRRPYTDLLLIRGEQEAGAAQWKDLGEAIETVRAEARALYAERRIRFL